MAKPTPAFLYGTALHSQYKPQEWARIGRANVQFRERRKEAQRLLDAANVQTDQDWREQLIRDARALDSRLVDRWEAGQ